MIPSFHRCFLLGPFQDGIAAADTELRDEGAARRLVYNLWPGLRISWRRKWMLQGWLGGGTPESSILIGFSIIFTIHFGVSIFGIYNLGGGFKYFFYVYPDP